MLVILVVEVLQIPQIYIRADTQLDGRLRVSLIGQGADRGFGRTHDQHFEQVFARSLTMHPVAQDTDSTVYESGRLLNDDVEVKQSDLDCEQAVPAVFPIGKTGPLRPDNQRNNEGDGSDLQVGQRSRCPAYVSTPFASQTDVFQSAVRRENGGQYTDGHGSQCGGDGPTAPMDTD